MSFWSKLRKGWTKFIGDEEIEDILARRRAAAAAKRKDLENYIYVPRSDLVLCMKLVPFEPENCLTSEAWKQLRADAKVYGVTPDQLRGLFHRWCKSTDPSLATVAVATLLKDVDHRYRHVIHPFILKHSARHTRMLFEDAVRMFLKFAAMDFHTALLTIMACMNRNTVLDLKGARDMVEAIMGVKRGGGGGRRSKFFREISRRLFSEHPYHSIDAFLHVCLRYPMFGIPFLGVQQAMQRNYPDLDTWLRYHAANGTLLFPIDLDMTTAEAMTARTIMLETASHCARPFVYGNEHTVAQQLWRQETELPSGLGKKMGGGKGGKGEPDPSAPGGHGRRVKKPTFPEHVLSPPPMKLRIDPATGQVIVDPAVLGKPQGGGGGGGWGHGSLASAEGYSLAESTGSLEEPSMRTVRVAPRRGPGGVVMDPFASQDTAAMMASTGGDSSVAGGESAVHPYGVYEDDSAAAAKPVPWWQESVHSLHMDQESMFASSAGAGEATSTADGSTVSDAGGGWGLPPLVAAGQGRGARGGGPSRGGLGALEEEGAEEDGEGGPSPRGGSASSRKAGAWPAAKGPPPKRGAKVAPAPQQAAAGVGLGDAGASMEDGGGWSSEAGDSEGGYDDETGRNSPDVYRDLYSRGGLYTPDLLGRPLPPQHAVQGLTTFDLAPGAGGGAAGGGAVMLDAAASMEDLAGMPSLLDNPGDAFPVAKKGSRGKSGRGGGGGEAGSKGATAGAAQALAAAAGSSGSEGEGGFGEDASADNGGAGDFGKGGIPGTPGYVPRPLPHGAAGAGASPPVSGRGGGAADPNLALALPGIFGLKRTTRTIGEELSRRNVERIISHGLRHRRNVYHSSMYERMKKNPKDVRLQETLPILPPPLDTPYLHRRPPPAGAETSSQQTSLQIAMKVIRHAVSGVGRAYGVVQYPCLYCGKMIEPRGVYMDEFFRGSPGASPPGTAAAGAPGAGHHQYPHGAGAALPALANGPAAAAPAKALLGAPGAAAPAAAGAVPGAPLAITNGEGGRAASADAAAPPSGLDAPVSVVSVGPGVLSGGEIDDTLDARASVASGAPGSAIRRMPSRYGEVAAEAAAVLAAADAKATAPAAPLSPGPDGESSAAAPGAADLEGSIATQGSIVDGPRRGRSQSVSHSSAVLQRVQAAKVRRAEMGARVETVRETLTSKGLKQVEFETKTHVPVPTAAKEAKPEWRPSRLYPDGYGAGAGGPAIRSDLLLTGDDEAYDSEESEAGRAAAGGVSVRGSLSSNQVPSDSGAGGGFSSGGEGSDDPEAAAAEARAAAREMLGEERGRRKRGDSTVLEGHGRSSSAPAGSSVGSRFIEDEGYDSSETDEADEAAAIATRLAKDLEDHENVAVREYLLRERAARLASGFDTIGAFVAERCPVVDKSRRFLEAGNARKSRNTARPGAATAALARLKAANVVGAAPALPLSANPSTTLGFPASPGSVRTATGAGVEGGSFAMVPFSPDGALGPQASTLSTETSVSRGGAGAGAVAAWEPGVTRLDGTVHVKQEGPSFDPKEIPREARGPRAFEKKTNTGFCAECDEYLFHVMADTFGYKMAYLVTEKTVVQPNALEAVEQATRQARAEGQPLFPVQLVKVGDGDAAFKTALRVLFEPSDGVYLRLLDYDTGRWFFWDSVSGNSSWIPPLRYRQLKTALDEDLTAIVGAYRRKPIQRPDGPPPPVDAGGGGFGGGYPALEDAAGTGNGAGTFNMSAIGVSASIAAEGAAATAGRLTGIPALDRDGLYSAGGIPKPHEAPIHARPNVLLEDISTMHVNAFAGARDHKSKGTTII